MQAELFPLAVALQRHAGSVFHGEVGLAVGSAAGIEDLGDVDVIHERDRLALGFESYEELLGGHCAADQLQGDLAFDGFGLRRQVDDSHAALAQEPLDDVAVDNRVGGHLRQATCTLCGETIDIGRLVSHHAMGIAAKIMLPDIVAPEDQDIWLLVSHRQFLFCKEERGALLSLDCRIR